MRSKTDDRGPQLIAGKYIIGKEGTRKGKQMQDYEMPFCWTRESQKMHSGLRFSLDICKNMLRASHCKDTVTGGIV